MTTIKESDRKVKNFLKKGGRKGAKNDFLKLLKKATELKPFTKKK